LFNGFEPRVFPDELVVAASGPKSSRSAHLLLQDIGKALEQARDAIATAQADMLLKYNRKHIPPPLITPGSSVWVNGEGISWPANQKRPNALQAPWLGPFAVSSGLDACDNVVVELPPSLARVEPTFHVSKLEPFVPNDPVEFPNRSQAPPEPRVNEDGQYEQELESILDMRWHHGKIQVLCKFLGSPVEEAEWQDYSVEDPSWDEDRALVVQYQTKHPEPLRSTPKLLSRRVRIANERQPAATSSLPTSARQHRQHAAASSLPHSERRPAAASSLPTSPPLATTRRSSRLTGRSSLKSGEL